MAKILIVDDLEDPRFAAAHLLEHDGHEVQVAASGMAALEAVRQSHVDKIPFALILLDIALQDIDGYTLAEIIRVLERPQLNLKPSKIAFFTAYSRSLVNNDMMRKAGVNVCWDKCDVSPRLPQLVRDCLAGDCGEEAGGEGFV